MSLETIVIICGCVFIAVIIGHALFDNTKAAKEQKERWDKEYASKMEMLKYRNQALQDQQIKMAQQNMATPWINAGRRSPELDLYERTQLALTQLQTLFLAGELEKQELFNATKMAASVDRENLTIVEEIIKVKLG